MIFGTVCSGIGAPEAAWAPLGWRCAFMSEIDTFPRAVLAHHYPATPLHGDFTTIQAGDYEPIDLLCGGTPCQSFSVAGLRGGMADARGNLALEFLRLADRLRPRWVVWENVPGVRSSGAGRDFGAFLGGLGELGYGWAYRSLDAQYAGLAQRRERVFVVAYSGDWRPAAAVLFEPASLRGDPPPRREAGERVAGPTEPRAAVSSGRGWWDETDVGATLRAQDSVTKADILIPIVSPALNARDYKGPSSDGDGDGDGDGAPLIVAHTLRPEGFDASEDGTGRAVPLVAASLTSGKGNGGNPAGRRQEHDTNLVAFAIGSHAGTADGDQTNRSHAGGGPVGSGISEEVAYSLRAGRTQSVGSLAAVRRLTPVECERLMGFSDNYTLVPYRKGMAADGPRYRALGNSMAVPVVRWIGRRIEKVDAQMRAHKEEPAWTE